MSKRFLFALSSIWLLLLLSSCSTSGTDSNEVVIFAASSLTESFRALASGYEEVSPECRIIFHFAGSQMLATHLLEGARADLFASADRRQMDRVREGGLADRPVPFATNRLVMIVPAGNPAGLDRVEDLARPGLRVVLGGESVPVGAYSRSALKRLGLLDRVEENVVSREEIVKGVLGKVLLGEADGGIVYATDLTPAVEDRVEAIELPPAGAVKAVYYIALLEDAPSRSGAEGFLRFLRSPEGWSILDRFRFGEAP